MFELNSQETAIYNAGERLIPGVTHNLSEEIRHRSSYHFFKKMIEADLQISNADTIKILDIGCGTGHGCRTLADIPAALVYGIDVSSDAIDYAKENYNAENISYRVANMQDLLAETTEYDYVVSRHAVEHIENGLNLCLQIKFRRRMIINVPYNEPAGNEFHLINHTTKASFSDFPNHEIYYEDLQGITVDDEQHSKINSIVCVSSKEGLAPITSMLTFPFLAWMPSVELIQQYKFIELHDRVARLETEIRFSFILRIERKLRGVFKKILSFPSRSSVI
jgi:SAM-dependent methyltransferase